MNRPNQFMFQTMLQHWIIKYLRQCYSIYPNMTLREFDELLKNNHNLAIDENMINVYTLAALGYSQLTYAKERGMLDECKFEMSDFGFEVLIEEPKYLFKSNKEYTDYYYNPDRKEKKFIKDSSMDRFILHYMRNSLAHSQFEILTNNVFEFKGDIRGSNLKYEIRIKDIQFEKFLNMLLEQAYGF